MTNLSNIWTDREGCDIALVGHVTYTRQVTLTRSRLSYLTGSEKIKTKLGVRHQLNCQLHGKLTLIYGHANTIITTLLKEINILINKCDFYCSVKYIHSIYRKFYRVTKCSNKMRSIKLFSRQEKETLSGRKIEYGRIEIMLPNTKQQLWSTLHK